MAYNYIRFLNSSIQGGNAKSTFASKRKKPATSIRESSSPLLDAVCGLSSAVIRFSLLWKKIDCRAFAPRDPVETSELLADVANLVETKANAWGELIVDAAGATTLITTCFHTARESVQCLTKLLFWVTRDVYCCEINAIQKNYGVQQDGKPIEASAGKGNMRSKLKRKTGEMKSTDAIKTRKVKKERQTDDDDGEDEEDDYNVAIDNQSSEDEDSVISDEVVMKIEGILKPYLL